MASESTNPNENKETNDTAALEAKIKELEAERDKLKQSVTNASADASKWKKEAQEKGDALKAKMSDEEKAKADQEAANAALQKELEDLRNERNIAKYAAALGGSDIGMDADTANEVASALNAGETEKVFDGIRRFIASHDKAMAEKAIMNNPKLPGGSSTKTVTKEEFKQMGLREMAAFKQEHPDLYMEYTKKT